MGDDVEYTNEPVEMKVVVDFLPSPEKLILKEQVLAEEHRLEADRPRRPSG